MKRKYIFILFLFALIFSVKAQNFTHQDTLRGSITPERVWWDLNYYDLNVEVNPDKKEISGTNLIRYKVLTENKILQVDLQSPLKIEKVTQDGKVLKVVTDGNAHFVHLLKQQNIGAYNEIVVQYAGQPKEAVNAPWDGGFSWKNDANGNPFIATSCQGLGASVWWPNKDHMYDEVDSMAISITTPKGLMDVSNGKLRKVVKNENSNTYHWFVNNPINNYGVNINIGNYVHFDSIYKGEKGKLNMDFFVLPENLEKAKKQFNDAYRMMEAFEHWFGPYPFYEDGFKLVEVPYLGMEHQSSVTYGNQYKNGYLGNDLSGTGWGLKFDFIIIHESGHEWFANNITYKDMADMWIHEGFTAYSENLFVDYFYGKAAAAEYVIGTRRIIANDKPIISEYNVNSSGSNDMYYKGANMLHTLRSLIDDDDKWRAILRGLNKDFYHQTVTTEQIENYLSEKSGIDLSSFFNQYLRSAKIPVLVYEIVSKSVRYRYKDIVQDFNMPLKTLIDGKVVWIRPNENWQTYPLAKQVQTFVVDKNYYVVTEKL